jgi:iron uptake system EfeUOB component EfeO/EfeM
MKKILSFLAVLTIVLLVAGCNSIGDNEENAENQPKSSNLQTEGNQQQNQNEEETKPADEQMIANELSNGSDQVIAVLDDLKANLEREAENSDLIQTTGKELEESWDEIEARVEEEYPGDYENIEKSLYPLIGEAQKDQGDSTKMKELIPETKEKLESFKKKLTGDN